MKNWYLLQSKLKQESVAQDNLLKQNYTVYCPKAKINQKTVNLFPRYLFVQLDKQLDNWTPIRSTKGVANFVRFGLEFAKVPDPIIQAIKMEEQKTVNKVIDLSKFHQGDKVRIKTGTFGAQEAIFASYDGDERVVVLMNIIGKKHSIKLNSNQVEVF